MWITTGTYCLFKQVGALATLFFEFSFVIVKLNLQGNLTVQDLLWKSCEVRRQLAGKKQIMKKELLQR